MHQEVRGLIALPSGLAGIAAENGDQTGLSRHRGTHPGRITHRPRPCDRIVRWRDEDTWVPVEHNAHVQPVSHGLEDFLRNGAVHLLAWSPHSVMPSE